MTLVYRLFFFMPIVLLAPQVLADVEEADPEKCIERLKADLHTSDSLFHTYLGYNALFPQLDFGIVAGVTNHIILHNIDVMRLRSPIVAPDTEENPNPYVTQLEEIIRRIHSGSGVRRRNFRFGRLATVEAGSRERILELFRDVFGNVTTYMSNYLAEVGHINGNGPESVFQFITGRMSEEVEDDFLQTASVYSRTILNALSSPEVKQRSVAYKAAIREYYDSHSAWWASPAMESDLDLTREAFREDVSRMVLAELHQHIELRRIREDGRSHAEAIWAVFLVGIDEL